MKTKNITLGGIKFEVRELTGGAYFDILENGSGTMNQREMVRASVFCAGEPIGEELEEMPASIVIGLVSAFAEVNNLAGDEGEELGKG